MPSTEPSRIRSRAIGLPPPLVLAIIYLILMIIGAALLMLPAASTEPLVWSQALFTAVSAVTVTGLVVVDTGSTFTLFGQAVILVLIQLGGLGIMTFAVLVLAMLGQPVGLKSRIYLRDELSQTSLSHLLWLVAVIFRIMLACQLLGMMVLATVFVPEFGWRAGLWQALFHAVSAFNNAGFSLFPDSLMRWATDPLINLAVPLLIIVGGLGFSVLADVYRQRRWSGFSLHTRLMLAGTAIVLPASIVLTAVLEWNNPVTLGQFPGMLDRLTTAWFQAVTSRTAGFNTLDIGELRDPTSLLLMGLMFVGAGSTSTAGGIKLTTLIVLLLAVLAFVRRRSEVDIFGRTLAHAQVMKLWVLSFLALLVVGMGLFAIVLSNQGDLLDFAFEAISAFATVGLSRGVTAELDLAGQITIMLLMFIGRVGPLALGLFLATRTTPRIRYPAGQVYIG
ncbi:MAG: TrkH family potassium uptake protein [Wenzhouxiangella sp.]